MTHFFLLLLRLGIGTESVLDLRSIENESVGKQFVLTLAQWQELMSLADKQGVLAIAFDGVQRLFETYGKAFLAAKDNHEEWMKWVLECAGMMTRYEQASLQQRKVLSKLSEIWASEGVKMMVFKGQTNATFFPIPNHRAAGDIDCWLFGDAKKGDKIMKIHGADVDFSWYRHSKISFQGETIENHRVMSHTRGNKKNQEMEEELRRMARGSLEANNSYYLEGCGKALKPSAQFNACFLTYHGLHHFTSEGLRMKQIIDWAMFLQKEQEEVDWNAYWDFCVRYKLDRFAAVMNYIAERCLNVLCEQSEQVRVNLNDNHRYGCEEKWVKDMAEKVLQATLYDDNYLFNSGKSDWMVRWLLVKNMFSRDRWKYRDIAQKNVWQQLRQNVTGFLFDKD